MPGTKREYTIDRGGRWERTVVGVDGQTHVVSAKTSNGAYVRGADGHYTDEGRYQRAIEAAAERNKRG